MANIIEITNFSDPALDFYGRYNESQLKNYKQNLGYFIAESPKVIERALLVGYEPVSFLMERKHIEGEGKNILSQYPHIPVYTADYDVLTNLTGFSLTRGMLSLMIRKNLPKAEQICKSKRRIVILENVMNPTNVGAIIRSAAALNMDALLLTPGCCDPLYRRAIRVSMGTVFQIPWTYLEPYRADPSQANLTILKDLGFKTAAMALTDASVSIDNKDLEKEEKLAIILGTEGEGLSKNTISSSDYTVKIPMSHGVDSLNVAAAGAVAFWQLGKQPTTMNVSNPL